MDLNTIWFVLVAVLVTGYAILDGFDLGVGVLHLAARDEDERRIHLNAIGPVWDGNEVWLITAGGALLAAFPPVYATVFSGFYLALVLLLVGLIFRAVAFEFRAKVASAAWKRVWDWAFGLGSLVAALVLGVALGNIVRGIPIDEAGRFTGTFLGLLNPYALLVGLTGLVLFVLHGAIYLAMKTEGALQERLRRWAVWLWSLLVVMWAAATAGTFVATSLVFEGLLRRPLFWLLAAATLGGLAGVPIGLRAARYGWAFMASSAVTAGLVGMTAVGLYPRLVVSSLDPVWSLTIYSAASTERTLTVMLIIALVGMPLVLVYTVAVYRLFRGKVVLGEGSY